MAGWPDERRRQGPKLEGKTGEAEGREIKIRDRKVAGGSGHRMWFKSKGRVRQACARDQSAGAWRRSVERRAGAVEGEGERGRERRWDQSGNRELVERWWSVGGVLV